METRKTMETRQTISGILLIIIAIAVLITTIKGLVDGVDGLVEIILYFTTALVMCIVGLLTFAYFYFKPKKKRKK